MALLATLMARHAALVGLDQSGFEVLVLIGKNSPKIENDFVVFDAGNDRWLRRAEAVGQLLSPVDAETVAIQGLLRRGSAAEGGTGGTAANRDAGAAQPAAQARCRSTSSLRTC